MEKWGEALGMCAVCPAFLCLCFPLSEDIDGGNLLTWLCCLKTLDLCSQTMAMKPVRKLDSPTMDTYNKDVWTKGYTV